MPHYRLVPSGRPDVSVDEIILALDDDGGVQHSVHVREARELSGEHYDEAVKIANRLGYKIVEAPAPREGEEEGSEEQEVGIDAEAQAPKVDVDQESQQSVAASRGDVAGTSTPADASGTAASTGAQTGTAPTGTTTGGSTPATPNT